ncbi:alpha/beta hydrolase [Streptomonospora sp. PA3]|uniref:alpha/beta hydrolase n=1 Tax=Streptomonospora sp. PA3 TaxID=2607326 RepID=UPI0012DFCFEE|nr:alpha/beta hydrolase [Streptomonospora sp. PA3]MUL42068.1 alpha/beta hydrolase [Streptomonospora sp. PA3]
MRSRRIAGRISAAMTALLASAALAAVPAGPASAAGTGPYDAEYTTTLRLYDHTIYRPADLPEDEDLPVVVWGNGGCLADGTMFEEFLLEIASHGFLVIANGRPGGSGRTDADMLTEAIDWAVEENDRWFSPYRGHLDTGAIAVMGQSCGGIEAYEASADDRVDTTVLWNSGMLSDLDNWRLRRLHAPIAYFTGGESDIAHANALDDWDRIPSDLPAFLGSLDVGHTGTFGQPDGGEYGRVGALWLKWRLKGDQQARQQFAGPDCGLCSTEWEVRQRNLA